MNKFKQRVKNLLLEYHDDDEELAVFIESLPEFKSEEEMEQWLNRATQQQD